MLTIELASDTSNAGSRTHSEMDACITERRFIKCSERCFLVMIVSVTHNHTINWRVWVFNSAGASEVSCHPGRRLSEEGNIVDRLIQFIEWQAVNSTSCKLDWSNKICLFLGNILTLVHFVFLFLLLSHLFHSYSTPMQQRRVSDEKRVRSDNSRGSLKHASSIE